VESPRGSIYAVAPVVALALGPDLSFGLSYHRLRGSSQYHFRLQSSFSDRVVYYALQDEESYAGAFVQFGMQARLTSWLAAGATLTSPWRYQITEKEEKIATLLFEVFALDTVATPANDLQKFELEVPLFYEAGFALQPNTRLTLAFDFAARPWSRAKLKTNGVTAPSNLLNSPSLRFGLEYLSTTKWAQFPLRLGYYTDPSPYRDRFFQGQYFGKQIEGSVITLGFSVLKKSWALHCAYETGAQEYSWWLDEGDFYNERRSSTKSRFNEITLEVSYRFASRQQSH